MPMQPRHEYERALHYELRDALNKHLTSTGFFVWLDVRPTATARTFQSLDLIVARTENWLNELDPDGVSEKKLPTLLLRDPAADVEITAIPRKPEVRDHRAAEIVGNPGPALVGWNE